MEKTKFIARETALITGASSGIGEVLAQRCAAAKYDVVLVARSVDKLQALAIDLHRQYGVAATVLAADLAQAGAAESLAQKLKRKKCQVALLINCAGVLHQGGFAGMASGQHRSMIDLNISGLTAMLSAFLPGMVAQGHGRVLNVASVAAFQPIPTLATYAATKAYVLSLSESLAEELRGSGVTITTLCPGITATQMFAQASSENEKLQTLPGFLIGDVQDVADQGLAACLRGDAICVPGAINQAAVIASRSTPKWLVRRIGGLLGRRAL
ncbi:MAG: short-chain dehydrogenase [Burkholderiales bacterium PBB4]|nr:MAG: short-chain dehydrogenase [Burkholderiales bacterium PBB4]